MTWLRAGLLIVLILAAFWLWWMDGRMEKQPTPQPTVTPAATQQIDRRGQREKAYEQDRAALQALVENSEMDEATREAASQQLAALIAQHQQELGLETALLEAGYENAVVLVLGGAVTVMIAQEQLTDNASAQILALCVAHAGVGAENVRIMALTS